MDNNFDLNINNYSLNDLLNLFQLPYNFTREQIKQAKKMVLKTHPDKSGLPKEYFLFFSKAYKMVYNIYEYRYKADNQSTEYIVEKNEEHEAILKNVKNKPNFNKWFNEMFENHKIDNEHDKGGYESWFRSDENIDDRKISYNEMNTVFQEKKKEVKDIVVKTEVQDINNQSGMYDLTGDKPSYYESDLFSSLQYDDLKKAHTETVVPVTEQDYLDKPKFNNVNHLREFRENSNSEPLSLQQSNKFLEKNKEMSDKKDIERAYKLLKQDEIVNEINKRWWGNVKQITNNN